MNPQPNTPASLNEAVADERALFEAHIVAEGYNAEHWLQRWRVGDAANKDRYIKDWVQTAWEAWKKRAALAAPGAAIDAREPFVEWQWKFANKHGRNPSAEDAYAAIDAREQEPPETISAKVDRVNLQVMRRFTSMWHADAVRLGYNGVGSLLESLTASRKEAPPASAQDMVLVPLKFIQGFYTLAHNYSLRAEPPDFYDGRAGDAFSNAYRRCGQDLAKLRDLIDATPSEALSPATVAQPAFYIHPKVIDPSTGTISPHINTAITWSRTPTPKHWTMPVYLAAQPCASQGCGGAELCQAAEEAIQWLNSWFRNHDGNKVAEKLRAALSKNN